MAKQVLSVADFVTIINLLNNEMHRVELNVINYFEETDYEEYKRAGENGMLKLRPTLADERVQHELRCNSLYNDLEHLKESLQNLNIEVETPDVEVSIDEEFVSNSIAEYAKYLQRSNEDEEN